MKLWCTSTIVIGMGVRRNFSRRSNVESLLILCRSLTMQCKSTFTKRFTLSTSENKCPILRQQSKNAFVGSSSHQPGILRTFKLKHHAGFKNWADELWKHAAANTALLSVVTQKSELNFRAAWCNYFWPDDRFAKMWQLADHFRQNYGFGRTEKRNIRLRHWYSIITQYQIAIFSITNLYQWGDCGRGFSDTIVPISLPMLVVARRWLLSSVSPVIRFMFLEWTCFIVINVAYSHRHTCACKLPNIVCRKLSVWERYLFRLICWSCLQLLKNVMLVLIKISYCNIYKTLNQYLGSSRAICDPRACFWTTLPQRLRLCSIGLHRHILACLAV